MTGTSGRIWRWSRVVLVCISLGLTGAQPALAEMTRPNVETGGSGAEATTNDVWLANAAYQNHRSIMLIEGLDAPVAVTEQESPSAFSLTPNGRSIALVESKEAPVAVARQESSSVSTLTTSDRSIALVESKEPSVSVADIETSGNQPVVGDDGNAFSVELVQSGSTDLMMCAKCAVME